MPINETIISAPVILFLGAGASSAFGKPMMQEFVDRLPTKLNYDENSALRAIHHFRGNDLEAILADLDTLIGLHYATAISVKYEPPAGHVPKAPLDNAQSVVTSRIERDTAIGLKASLEHAIIEEYGSIRSEPLVRAYRALFDQIYSHIDTACLPVFTTNYDPAVEEFCKQMHAEYRLTDGFVHDAKARNYYWDRSVFDAFGTGLGKRDVILFKLHGSTDWVQMEDGSVRRERPLWHPKDARYKNVLIYPAMFKVATVDPYYTAYDYFQRCCEKASLCIAIGYSFRDYDALTRLRSAMNRNAALNVAVIAPDAVSISDRIYGPNERKPALNFSFGFPGDTGYIEHLNQQLEQMLQRSKAAKK